MSDLEPEHLRKVFIGGLHPDTTDDSLSSYFSKYGKIVDCIVMRDGQTRRSRGFGFVAFDKSECVDQLQAERPHVLDGKEVDTKRVVPKNAGANSQNRGDREQKVNKVFIGGLKDEITEDDVKTVFSQFGSVERVETFTDKESGRRKGFAFVTFTDFDSVDKCILQAQTNTDGKLNLQGYKVEVKKARSQEEMKGGPGGGGGGRGGRGGYGPPGRGGGGRGGFRGGRMGGYGDYSNQGYGGQGGYNNGYGGYGGGSGAYNSAGFGGAGDGYNGSSGGYGGGGGGWSGSQGGNWNGPQGGYGGQNGGGYGGGATGGYGGGGPMRGGFNKNRPTPYGGGGGSGWRN